MIIIQLKHQIYQDFPPFLGRDQLFQVLNAGTSGVHEANLLIFFGQEMHWAEPIAGPFPHIAHHVV